MRPPSTTKRRNEFLSKFRDTHRRFGIVLGEAHQHPDAPQRFGPLRARR
jgi:hypothetical protein